MLSKILPHLGRAGQPPSSPLSRVSCPANQSRAAVHDPKRNRHRNWDAARGGGDLYLQPKKKFRGDLNGDICRKRDASGKFVTEGREADASVTSPPSIAAVRKVYSIASSARSRIAGGMARPSALAAL